MNDDQALVELVDDLDAVLRLLRKHRPVDGFCPACGVFSVSPCRPYRLARTAAFLIGERR